MLKRQRQSAIDRREEALAATALGSAFLRYGLPGGELLESLAGREAVLDRMEEVVDEELKGQEKALRSIPLGKQHLSEAEQARAGGAEEWSPSLAERESMIHTAIERLKKDFDKHETRLVGLAGHENLLVEVAGDLDLEVGTLGERWRVIEAAARRLDEVQAELERAEAAILEDPAGSLLLSHARREVLGDAAREAETLADRAHVIMAAVDEITRWTQTTPLDAGTRQAEAAPPRHGLAALAEAFTARTSPPRPAALDAGIRQAEAAPSRHRLAALAEAFTARTSPPRPAALDAGTRQAEAAPSRHGLEALTDEQQKRKAQAAQRAGPHRAAPSNRPQGPPGHPPAESASIPPGFVRGADRPVGGRPSSFRQPSTRTPSRPGRP
ncbi:MAG: hypothetical protein OXG35_10255 [Acidobacteria bacterium]|nr:hypothetical protein [Acidobacteriota bacterium]